MTYEPGTSDQDLWIDDGLHGTHVTGTMVGNGHSDPRFAGMAPLVRHIRFAKVLHHLGFGSGDSIRRGMDWLSRPSGCGETGGSPASVKPLVVNMSLGVAALEWEGRGVGERKIDSIVWNHGQLYVVAQANRSIHGFSDYSTAKNSLAVGAVRDDGDLAIFSSSGPTADGRLAPQVVGTGVLVRSARGAGNRGGYATSSGTSMASPAVAGVAALLMDAVPAFREQPALTRARLMASAIKPDAFLEDPHRFAVDNSNGPAPLQHQYGLGKVSARTSVLNRDQADGWVSGSAVSELADGEYAYQDILVPENAGRLDLVMTWDEPPTDTIASAVLNDLDLWVDLGADCETAACGEYASRSRIDNVEWVIVRNPVPGTYRVKTVARRVYTAAPRAALAWTVIRGASTPQLRVIADRQIVNVLPGQTYEINLRLTADEYVAAGATLRIDCRAAADSDACSTMEFVASRLSAASREDGLSRSLEAELDDSGIHSISLGEVAAGEKQRIELVFRGRPSEEAFHLYFTAGSWNATGDSASVRVRIGDPDDPAPAEARPPANDGFAAPARIQGQVWPTGFDLLLATPEPGEPSFNRGVEFVRQVRPRSVWHTWTAPASAPFRFSIGANEPEESQGLSDEVQLDVFEGNQFVSLSRTASKRGGLTFIAKGGQTYRIRLSILNDDRTFVYRDDNGERRKRQVVPMVLYYSGGSRPANDDFRLGRVLEGETGRARGSNQGATLEAGELLGSMAATTWYRWTAPSDGDWRFSVDRRYLNVLVFVGDGIGGLRLVSRSRDQSAAFPALAGNEYRIAVAADDAFAAGNSYELTWEPGGRAYPGNDDFANAAVIAGLHSSSYEFFVSPSSTVEPGEPVATGTTTRWFAWDAPRDGEYTWRLAGASLLDLAVFTGGSLHELQLAASTAAGAKLSRELKFTARAGERYWIAAGLPADVALGLPAYVPGVAGTLEWGLSPANDDLPGAASLTGASGSVSGSNRFATLEGGERTPGHSSLWWTWTAPSEGWYRFRLDGSDTGVLAVYRLVGNDIGSLEQIDASAGSVFLPAEAGVRYAIRIGSRGEESGGDFTMRWSQGDPPAWIRYVGRIVDGDVDAAGALLEIRGPNSLAFNTQGTELYASSDAGLLVFERDPESGDLTWVQSLGEELGISGFSSLLWDSHRSRLYVNNFCTWRKFAPLEGSPGLEYEGEVSYIGCFYAVRLDRGDTLLMDSTASFIHIVKYWQDQVVTLALDASASSFQHVETVQIEGDLKHAAISTGETYLYAVTRDSLLVFERDTETGKLQQVETLRNGDEIEQRTIEGLSSLEAVAIGGGRYLFALDNDGGSTVFELGDEPSKPRFLDTLPRFWDKPTPFFYIDCQLALGRTEASSVDVFCAGSAFTSFSVGWRPESRELLGMNFLAPWQADRFGAALPDDFYRAGWVAASPDDKHLYLSGGYDSNQILIFKRVDAADFIPDEGRNRSPTVDQGLTD